MVGNIKEVNGKTYILPDYYDDGLACGTIFKDEDSYKNDSSAICYVPECVFDELEPDSEGYYEIKPGDGYSHQDLLDLCGRNPDLCDCLFQDLAWLCPETYIQEWDCATIAYFFRFVKAGSFVTWNDPSELKSGRYIVVKAPFEFDEYDELVDEESFDFDKLVTITNYVETFEVPVCELTK